MHTRVGEYGRVISWGAHELGAVEGGSGHSNCSRGKGDQTSVCGSGLGLQSWRGVSPGNGPGNMLLFSEQLMLALNHDWGLKQGTGSPILFLPPFQGGDHNLCVAGL